MDHRGGRNGFVYDNRLRISHAGTSARLPSDLHTIYVPTIVNTSQAYRVGQMLTEAVVRELRDAHELSRGHRRTTARPTRLCAGIITGVSIAPLTYDSVTGRISSSMVGIGISVSLTTKSGKVLWSNPNFVYREQYQESIDARDLLRGSGPGGAAHRQQLRQKRWWPTCWRRSRCAALPPRTASLPK